MKLHKRFFRSLYSMSSMSHFRLFGVGSTILYVLLLTFLCMLPIAILFLLNLYSSQGTESLNNFQTYGLDQDQMQHFANSMNGVMPILLVVVYLSMYILFSGILFSGISVIAAIGLPISSKKNLNYRHLWVICCYTITLPVVLLTLLIAFNVQLPHSFLMFWLLTFLIFTVSILNTPVRKKSNS
jgi:hypothetical protein